MNNLEGLHPTVKQAAEKLLEECKRRNINVVITEGYRSFERQAELYARGRTTPGNIVTNARPGESYHNYGLAIDYALKDKNGKVYWNVDKDWLSVAEIGKSLGFSWGGDWKGFKDYPHLEMTFGLTIKDLLAGKRPKEEFKMKREDATQVALLLGYIWQLQLDQKSKDEIHRLANEVRKAGGLEPI